MQTAISSFMALVFSFSIIGAQSFLLIYVSSKSNIVSNNIDANQSNNLTKYSSSLVHNNPVETIILSNETEDSKEDETKDSSEDEFNSIYNNNYYEYNFTTPSVKNLFNQLAISIQNRSSVSLFILHHSWKSFLA